MPASPSSLPPMVNARRFGRLVSRSRPTCCCSFLLPCYRPSPDLRARHSTFLEQPMIRVPGTMKAPWRTIQHAADAATADSKVNVRGGVYEERVAINVSGDARDGSAILDGERLTPEGRSGMLVFLNKNY